MEALTGGAGSEGAEMEGAEASPNQQNGSGSGQTADAMDASTEYEKAFLTAEAEISRL